MADSTTTGSILSQGLMPGMAGGAMMTSGTNQLIPNMIIVTSNPNFGLTSITGSDIAYSVGNGNFYIGDITAGAGGSEWSRLGSLT